MVQSTSTFGRRGLSPQPPSPTPTSIRASLRPAAPPSPTPDPVPQGRKRRYGRLTSALVIVAGLALGVARGYLGHHADTSLEDPATANVGPMPAWAKLYPGAVVTETQPMKSPGLVSWYTGYTAQATPQQIDAFYSDVARDEGFTDKGITLGRHFYEDTHNDRFSYSVDADNTLAKIDLDARVYDLSWLPSASK